MKVTHELKIDPEYFKPVVEIDKIKEIIAKWLRCEITGDNAMGQVAEIFKNSKDNADAYTEEKLE